MKVAVSTVLILVAATSFAQTDDERALSVLKSAKCEFYVVAASHWEKEAPSPTIERQEFGFHIDGIDRTVMRARLTGKLGSETLAMTVRGQELHFVGFKSGMNLTTIFAQRSPEGYFKAVHSRHGVGGGSPLASQTYGFCRQLE